MFVRALEIATQFTRPVHSLIRNYESPVVQPGTATLFFVNSDGWALTARHVADAIFAAKQIGEKREAFLKELADRTGEMKLSKLKNELEKKYGWTRSQVYELYNTFVNCTTEGNGCQLYPHPQYDVALIKFDGKLQVNTFPVFGKVGTDLKQGKFLCRLGFPFPEFSNYRYDEQQDKVLWTDEGRQDSPRFPIEGMLTRHLVDNNKIVGFEMSTPGIRGQSGGPAFDTEGRVWGLQSATNHLDLDFDVNQEVLRMGKKQNRQDSAFLHVGHCVHVDVLKDFMREHKVAFQEA